MQYGDYICFDLETSGKTPDTAQIVQIAAVTIHGRRLEIKEETKFNTLVKPLYGAECEAAGLQELTDDAIRIHGKTHEMLENAPSLESALKNFKDYVDDKNYKKNSWNAPVAVGYNIIGYDIPILERDLAKCKLEPFFQPVYRVDMLHYMFGLFENCKETHSLSADNLIRKYMGYSKGEAHDALSDVMMTAELFCRVFKYFRKSAVYTKMKGCFE